MGLIKNELIKIFGKKLTYFVLIGVIFISVALPALEYFANDYFDSSEYYIEQQQQEIAYLQESLSSDMSDTFILFNKAILEVYELLLEAGVNSYQDWRQAASDSLRELYHEKYLTQAFIDKDKNIIKEIEQYGETYMLDEEALNYYYRYTSAKKFIGRMEEIDESIENYREAFLKNDPTFVNQYSVDQKKAEITFNEKAILDLNKSLRYASKSNKESINEQIAALEKQNELNAEILVWLEYEAEHGFYPAYTDWRHKCISNIIEQISLKYADPLTIGEFEETRQPGTYEAYLTQFEIDQESADDEILLKSYSLEQNIPPMLYERSTRWHLNNSIYYTIVIVSILILLIVSPIVSREYSNGTIRLLLTRPKNRLKVLLSKYFTSLLIALVMTGLAFGAYFLAIYYFYGSADLVYPVLSVLDGQIISQTVFEIMMPAYFTSLLVVLFIISLSFFFTTVTKSTIMAIAVPFVLIFFSDFALTALVNMSLFNIANYSIFPYLQLWEIINNTGTPSYYMETYTQLHFSANYGILLLCGSSILLFALSAWVFSKRDVKN